ncbi:MAG: hypothetical protein EXQ55_09500 [Acidobacteria bacterium]|nr:hypothetical protein [Acidobacteriota bacterium]
MRGGRRRDRVKQRTAELPVNADEPRPLLASVAHDEDALLLRRSPLEVVGNQARDVGVEDGAAQEQGVRVFLPCLIEITRISPGFLDDLFELNARPRRDVERDLSGIPRLMRLDGGQPLQEAIGRFLRADRLGQRQDHGRCARAFEVHDSSHGRLQ